LRHQKRFNRLLRKKVLKLGYDEVITSLEPVSRLVKADYS